jgi:hypothetical protein
VIEIEFFPDQKKEEESVGTGLPDFSWCNIPKIEKIFQMTKHVPNDHKI